MRHERMRCRTLRRAVEPLLIVLVGTIAAVALHQVHHDPLMTLTTKAKSVVLSSGVFPPVAFASLFVAFGVLAATFLAIQGNLGGSGVRKGARFGIALGGMYLVGMIEAYVVYPVQLAGELYTGGVDGAGILVMSTLLGRHAGDDDLRSDPPALAAFVVIPVIYVLARYFSYAVLGVESSLTTRPFATLVWTTVMAVWVAVMYLLVGTGTQGGTPAAQAATFGGLVFGVNWLVFNLFALLFIQVSVLDLIARSLVDSLAAMAGTYLVVAFAKASSSGRVRSGAGAR